MYWKGKFMKILKRKNVIIFMEIIVIMLLF